MGVSGADLQDLAAYAEGVELDLVRYASGAIVQVAPCETASDELPLLIDEFAIPRSHERGVAGADIDIDHRPRCR
jgi:hypothetical protein